jgi:hypothetical protein
MFTVIYGPTGYFSLYFILREPYICHCKTDFELHIYLFINFDTSLLRVNAYFTQSFMSTQALYNRFLNTPASKSQDKKQ